jgi:hypothetical protein
MPYIWTGLFHSKFKEDGELINFKSDILFGTAKELAPQFLKDPLLTSFRGVEK